jgi:serine/threonine-protein phosphatase CPPED1
MTIRPILITLAFAGTLAAQTFLQMSDPQFGMFSKNENFAHETVNFDFAIATANRLKPAFVVITGDLINESTNSAQAAEYKRICAKLDSKIPLYSIPGNHDVGNEPTAETLARYRERNGPDYYTFRSGEMAGIVLNSNLEKGTKNVPDEAAKMEAWFKSEIAKVKASGAKQIIVFQHIPFFQKNADEEEVYNNIPVDVRKRYLKLLHDNGVQWVFAGHLHYNLEARDGDLQMIATGPVGMPLGKGKSGLRVVAVTPQGVKHQYFDFGELPETLELK